MSRDFYPRVARAHQEFEEEMRLHRRGVWFEDREATLSSDEPGRALRSKTNANNDAVKTTYLKSEIEPLLKQSMGRTMPGDFSPMLVFDLFEKSSSEWEVIAKRHKDRISKLSTEFLHEVINSTWPERMRSRLWSEVVSKQIKDYEGRGDGELNRLHEDRLRRVAPYGPDYLAKIEELQQKLSFQDDQTPESHGLFLKMLAFYELTCKTFVTNVIVQVVERHIIHGLDSIFMPIKLFEMAETTVSKIASEDEETQNRRRNLERKVTDLDDIYSEFQGTIIKTKQKKPTVVHASENTTHSKQKSRRAATSTPNDQHPPERTRRVVTRPPRSLSSTSESESQSETERASPVKPNSRLKQAADGSKRTGGGRHSHDKEVPAARRRASSQVDQQDVRNEERNKSLTKQQPENLIVNSPSMVSKEGNSQIGTKDLAVELLETFRTDARVNDTTKDARARPVIDARARVGGEDWDPDLAY